MGNNRDKLNIIVSIIFNNLKNNRFMVSNINSDVTYSSRETYLSHCLNLAQNQPVPFWNNSVHRI